MKNVKVWKTEYKGWQEAIEIDNNHLKMVIVPSISRIMFFGFKDGKNILWNNEEFAGKNIEYTEELLRTDFWANYGGDKVWTTEQNDFPVVLNRSWPPDETFDGGKFKYEILENGLKITSNVSKYSNTQLIRTITTESDSNLFKIAQTVICKGKNSKVPVTIWNVTQLSPPTKYIFDWNKESKFDGNIKYLMKKFDAEIEYLDNYMIMKNVINDMVKIGTHSKKFLSTVWKNTLFTQSFHYIKNEKYPDGDCPVEVFISPEYIEMELLSPLRKLKNSESLTYDIEWTLDELNSTKNNSIIRIIKSNFEDQKKQ